MKALLTYRVDGVTKALKSELTFAAFGSSELHVQLQSPERERPQAAHLLLRITVESAADWEDARRRADEVATKVIDRISYFWGFEISKPFFVSGSTEAGTAARDMVRGIVHGFSLRQRFSSLAILNESQESALVAFLGSRTEPKEYLFQFFRQAISCEDPIAWFMCFCALLVDARGPEQSKVDAFIRNQEPGVPERSKTMKGKEDKQETVYTSLRNEIGHPQLSRPFQVVQEEMTERMDGLVALVKMAIAG